MTTKRTPAPQARGRHAWSAMVAVGLLTTVSSEAMAQIRDGMDAICFAAGWAVTAWPIGTLIAGPTVIGCIMHYAAQ